MKMSALTTFSVIFCVIGLMILFIILASKILHKFNIPPSLEFIKDFNHHMINHDTIYNYLLCVGMILSIMGISFGYESYIDKHYIN